MKVKMKVKKWRPEKLKMVKKHFFPELSGDLWGVICYHHWYPRAGLEGREKSYFSKKVWRLKKMQNYPLSIFHVAVRPESLPGADLSTFQKVIFSKFSVYFGPFRAPFWSKITPHEFVSNYWLRVCSCFLSPLHPDSQDDHRHVESHEDTLTCILRL